MSELLSLPALIARLKAWKSDIATTGSVTATNGLYDGANRAYSVGNPPPQGSAGVGNALYLYNNLI